MTHALFAGSSRTSRPALWKKAAFSQLVDFSPQAFPDETGVPLLAPGLVLACSDIMCLGVCALRTVLERHLIARVTTSKRKRRGGISRRVTAGQPSKVRVFAGLFSCFKSFSFFSPITCNSFLLECRFLPAVWPCLAPCSMSSSDCLGCVRLSDSLRFGRPTWSRAEPRRLALRCRTGGFLRPTWSRAP